MTWTATGKDYTENFPEGGKFMHVVGPFDDLRK